MIEPSRVWPFVATFVFIALLGYFTWRQPNRPGKRFFRVIVAIWLLWAAAVLLELTARTAAGREFPALAQVFLGAAVSPFTLFFALDYAGHSRWLTGPRIALLLLPALIIGLVGLTNPYHHWFWTETSAGGQVIEVRSLAGWAGIAYGYLLWLANLVVLAGCLLRAPAFAAPILLVLAGQLVPRVAFLASGSGPAGLSSLQLALLASNITALAYFLALFNFRMLRVSPIGRAAVLERVPYAMIVLDAEGRVVDLNPAASSLPGIPQAIRLGQPARTALGPWWEHLAPLVDIQPLTREVEVAAGGARQVYEAHSLPLVHASGWQMGRAFILSDTTAAREARRQKASRQWALATLEEREQLAQELHDGLSQNLAFLNVQAQAARAFLQAGKVDTANDCLERLNEVSRQVQGDTRELIGDLLVVSLPAEGFNACLGQVLARFEQQTGLRSMLVVDGPEEAFRPAALDNAVAVQLLRIVQEALANVRKHARCASQVEVRLSAAQGQVRVKISDDGEGYDPAAAQADGLRHFGLNIMRQRAARLGGQLDCWSAPGMGAVVEVTAPQAKEETEVQG